MKKLYTLALAAAVAASASAADFEIKQLAGAKLQSNQPVKTEITATAKAVAKKAPMRAASRAASIEGDYTFTLGDYYFQGGQGLYTIAGTVEKYDATTLIFDSQAFPTEVIASYNEASQTVTFDGFNIGWNNFSDGKQYFVTFEAGEWVETSNGQGNLVAKSFTATFDPATGSIAFPSDHYFAWAAYTDESCSESTFYGFADIFDVIAMTQGSATETPDLSLIGEASFTENLIYPLFNDGKENTKVSKHEIYTDGQGTYYVIEAFSTLYTENGWPASESPYLILDATNPDNVMLPLTETGIGNGTYPYYLFGQGWYVDQTEDTSEWSPELAIKKTKDGDKVTITFPVHSTSIMLANQTNPQFYYGSIFASTLTFTESEGISGVEADSNAPVTYYNLQGVRLDQPTTGVVIRVQGNNATKMVVK